MSLPGPGRRSPGKRGGDERSSGERGGDKRGNGERSTDERGAAAESTIRSYPVENLAPPEELAGLAKIAPVMNRSTTPMQVRTGPEVRAFFDGFDLVEPGLVQISRWRPDLASAAEGAPQGEGIYAYAGVGRKS